MQDECLYIEQPESCGKHHCDCEGEENSRARVTKSSERGRTECNKVGQDPEGRRRNASDSGIDAGEDRRATTGRTTDKVVPGKVHDGEINSISQPDETEQRRDGIKNCLGACPGHLRLC